ncbi:MAG: D-glycero-beta-D-manno-heptose 1-phosphate adenylyltransferase [Oceanicaulis sp.]
MKREQAAKLLARIAGKRALVLGDLLLDSFVYGEVRRISREAPAPILSQRRRSDMLGGAGNLARNIESLGGQAMLVSALGDDDEAARAAELARAACAERVQLVRSAGRSTPTKIRYVAQNQQMFCVDRDPDGPVSSADEDALIAALREAIGEADILILSDYGRGVITPRTAQAAITIAHGAGVPVSVDPRGTAYERYDGATVIKPNADELAAVTGEPVRDDAGAVSALQALKTALPETAALLVTRCAAGMTLLDVDGEAHHHRATPRDVFDVSGAGDTALAALSLAMAAGIGLKDAMALADLCAGVAVTKPGTAVVTPDEVVEVSAIGEDAPDWRVLSVKRAADLAASWRAQGLRVGFTNGCFDILHPGHLSVLRFAASACDRLIVGLNADDSVRRLKGPERPVNDEETRAVMLSSLEMVDRVVIFEEDTPEALIRALRPHVMIKGADYTADALPGAAFMREIGGEILLAPLLEGRSTSNIVAKMKS